MSELDAQPPTIAEVSERSRFWFDRLNVKLQQVILERDALVEQVAELEAKNANQRELIERLQAAREHVGRDPLAGITHEQIEEARHTLALPAKSGPFMDMPNPTGVDLVDPVFEAIWQATKTWDVNAPWHYAGYCGMNGSHVMLILNAVREALGKKFAALSTTANPQCRP